MAYTKKNRSGKTKRDTWIVLGFMLLVLIVIAVLILFFTASKNELPEVETAGNEISFDVPGFTILQEAPTGDLNEKFSLACVGTYSGTFVEDGLDEQVTDVLTIVVQNISSDLIEYGLITLDCGGETASFELSALPAGSYVLVMEKNRLTYNDTMELSKPTCEQYAEPNNLVMDFGNDFKVYPSDGVINIENISGRDIESDVSLFYKNYEYGLFFGGITYRARFSGGVKAGQIAQCMQQHYSLEKSAIMYMSYEQ